MNRSGQSISFAIPALALSLLLAPMASGASITVVNPSFEDPSLPDGAFNTGTITGWTVTGTEFGGVGFAGVMNPIAGETFSGPGTTDGNQVAYIQINSTISQTLTSNFAADTVYTLRIDVGARKDGVFFSPYKIGLYAGATLLVEDNSSLTPVDGFLTSTLAYASPAFHPALGQPLGLRMASLDPVIDVQVIFDNVRLDAVPTPEPSSILLLAFGTAALFHTRPRRRQAR